MLVGRWLVSPLKLTVSSAKDEMAATAPALGSPEMVPSTADLEADGRWDLYVLNMSSEEGMPTVLRAEGLSIMPEWVMTIARGDHFYRESKDPKAPWGEVALQKTNARQRAAP